MTDGEIAALGDEMDRAMRDLAHQSEIETFGGSRDDCRLRTTKRMRLHKRELEAMTVAEIESAMMGFDTSWEWLPEEDLVMMPSGTLMPASLIGITGWSKP